MGDWTGKDCEVWLLWKLEAKARRGTAWGTRGTERVRQPDGVLVRGGGPRSHQRSLDLIPEEVRP